MDSRFAQLSGLLAWLAWAFVHLMFLPAAGNRIRVWTQASGPTLLVSAARSLSWSRVAAEEPAPSQTELSALPGSAFEPTSAFK